MKFIPPLLAMILLGACDADVAAPPGTDLAIHEIQGSGSASALVGQYVTTTGVVSGDFQDDDADAARNLGGFFLQSLEADNNPLTSEGLFVFDRKANGVDVHAGDIVRVQGIVEERFGETQLTANKLERAGSAAVHAVELRLPGRATVENSDGLDIADLEAYEGMLVSIPQRLYVQDLGGLERFGEIVLASAARQFSFTSRNAPDPDAYRAHRKKVAAQRLVLDDGRAVQNAQPLAYVGGDGFEGRAPRLGDATEGLQGVLRFSRGSGPHGTETWRLMPTATPRFSVRNPRPEPPQLQGDVIVASVNLLNYFSTIDDGSARCGPAQDVQCRGAESTEELQRQRLRTANAINQSGADVVGLMELENNSGASMADLLAALNASGATWRQVDTGAIGSDTIRVAMIYQPERVLPVGAYAILDGSKDPRFNDARNRPVLAQTFRAVASGGVFTLAVNHLKSKGSPCDAEADPDLGDGQGNCNETRTQAAQALADWLAQDPTGSGDADSLIIGDLNALQEEDPLRTLERAGFESLVRSRLGAEAYSYAYRGESGVLDHALASASLAPQVNDVVEWHINADEASLHDYNLNYGRDPALFDPAAPWRAADHDPLLVALTLRPD